MKYLSIFALILFITLLSCDEDSPIEVDDRFQTVNGVVRVIANGQTIDTFGNYKNNQICLKSNDIELSVFPTPASDQIDIMIANSKDMHVKYYIETALSSQELKDDLDSLKINIKQHDEYNKKLIKGIDINKGVNSFTYDLDDLKDGLYIIYAESNGEIIACEPFIKKEFVRIETRKIF